MRFFSETSVQSHKFLHLTHAPPFWKFFIKYNEQWTKTFSKNRLTGPVKNRSTGRSTGDDFEIYRSGRVENFLTGSISEQEDLASISKQDIDKILPPPRPVAQTKRLCGVFTYVANLSYVQ